MKDDKTNKLNIALWRYSIIAPLLHRDPQGESMQAMLHRLETRSWHHPQGRTVQLSGETLRKWLYRYRHGGLPALSDQTRCDRGSSAIAEGLSTAMHDLRQSHPRWTLSRILDELKATQQWNGRRPSRSTLYRYAKNHNLKRDPHRQPVHCRAFAFEVFGQLWMADFLHGPKLRVGRKRRKTYLHAILDDSSRYVVVGAFSFHENTRTLLSDLMLAIRRFGVPQRFYTDNGACYASRHLKLVCARLGIQLIHTPPYRPQGRGKVERFFRSVRDQFLTDRTFGSLDALNQAFQDWLSEYHERIHRALDATPLQVRLAHQSVCREFPQALDLEPLFRMERRCRVYQNGTVRLFRRHFEVPGCLPNTRITVYYLPWNFDLVFFGDDMTPARPLDHHANAHRFHRP